MARKIFNLLFFVFFLLSGVLMNGAHGAEPATTEKVKSLVDRVVQAYGGKEAIERVKSAFIKGKITAFMPVDKGTYIIYFKVPRKLRVHIVYRDYTEERILNGHRGYEGTDTYPVPEVTGFRYLAIVYQYKSQDIPYGLLHDAYRLSNEGIESVNGIPVEVLGLKDKEGLPMKIYINPKNFHVVKISGLFSIGGNEMTLSSEFTDFRSVGGMEFPFKLTNYAGGQKVAETLIEEYKVNTDIDNSIFEPRSPSHAERAISPRRFKMATKFLLSLVILFLLSSYSYAQSEGGLTSRGMMVEQGKVLMEKGRMMIDHGKMLINEGDKIMKAGMEMMEGKISKKGLVDGGRKSDREGKPD